MRGAYFGSVGGGEAEVLNMLSVPSSGIGAAVFDGAGLEGAGLEGAGLAGAVPFSTTAALLLGCAGAATCASAAEDSAMIATLAEVARRMGNS
ncbi:hypothetical protein F1C10_12785 [Sphingomonas sp. NBWT7]|uniref:hypothetical protein n=1 Tax=Sphingomonas sp. NBWT7 TaxID=2596913 RepID=UPI001623FA25|nr:hypothetical protein [Sphingomonas sp. NBWT7]QNE32716.1 hypothetical protein F1C10_12785 [Sphingomonas sp. NBWT7]